MQSRLAAILAGPFGPRSDQADAGTVGVVVYFPRCGEQRFDIFVREKIRRAVRTVHDTDIPFVGITRNLGFRQGLKEKRQRRCIAPPQHVTNLQCAAGVAAEFSKDESGTAAEIFRHLDSAPHGDVRARARINSGAQPQP